MCVQTYVCLNTINNLPAEKHTIEQSSFQARIRCPHSSSLHVSQMWARAPMDGCGAKKLHLHFRPGSLSKGPSILYKNTFEMIMRNWG